MFINTLRALDHGLKMGYIVAFDRDGFEVGRSKFGQSFNLVVGVKRKKRLGV
jgi:hypothetical protein